MYLHNKNPVKSTSSSANLPWQRPEVEYPGDGKTWCSTGTGLGTFSSSRRPCPLTPLGLASELSSMGRWTRNRWWCASLVTAPDIFWADPIFFVCFWCTIYIYVCVFTYRHIVIVYFDALYFVADHLHRTNAVLELRCRWLWRGRRNWRCACFLQLPALGWGTHPSHWPMGTSFTWCLLVVLQHWAVC